MAEGAVKHDYKKSFLFEFYRVFFAFHIVISSIFGTFLLTFAIYRCSQTHKSQPSEKSLGLYMYLIVLGTATLLLQSLGAYLVARPRNCLQILRKASHHMSLGGEHASEESSLNCSMQAKSSHILRVALFNLTKFFLT
nr:hypothetical transcript [Hymenolepis microstoma]